MSRTSPAPGAELARFRSVVPVSCRARSSSLSSCGVPRSPASGWCARSPSRSRCSPSQAGPMSCQPSSAPRSSSSPGPMTCDRLMGVQMAAVIAGPRMGDVKAGAVANALGATTSVVSGGLACIVGALALARLLPAFRRQVAPASQDAAELAASALPSGSGPSSALPPRPLTIAAMTLWRDAGHLREVRRIHSGARCAHAASVPTVRL
jgi:hypothetical protein